MPYEEIARGGGGIASSARALAAASDGEVLAQAREIRAEMLAHGTTTVEGKTGYGLSREGELRAVRLGARGRRPRHRPVRPRGARRATTPRAGWTRSTRWPPRREVDALDIYVESVAFRNEDLERLGEIARREGVPLRAHVEQFNANRSVPVALAAGARSVDHLACLHPDDLAPLAAAECAAVLLPGAEFLGAEELAPGRALADAGAICVLATDCNPGTSPVVSLPLVIGLAVRRYGWTAREALAACTLNAAWVLGYQRPRLDRGRQARRPRRCSTRRSSTSPYRFGHNPVRRGASRRDRRRRARGAARRPRPDRARRGGRHHAAGLDRRGRAGGGLVRAPRGGDRAADGARPGRQPVGVPGRAAAVVGGRLAPRQRARAAGASTARSASPPASRWPSALPVAVISFADEEGARFNTPTFGSRALVGRLDVDDAVARVDDHGVTLGDAMAAAGVDPDGLSARARLARPAGRLPRAAHRPDARPRRRARAGRRRHAAGGAAAAAGRADRPGRPRGHDAARGAPRRARRRGARDRARRRRGGAAARHGLHRRPHGGRAELADHRALAGAPVARRARARGGDGRVVARGGRGGDGAGGRGGGRRARAADRRVVAGHRVPRRRARGAAGRAAAAEAAARLLRRPRRRRDRRRAAGGHGAGAQRDRREPLARGGGLARRRGGRGERLLPRRRSSWR